MIKTITLYPTKDSYMSAGATTTNYGAADDLIIRLTFGTASSVRAPILYFQINFEGGLS